MSHESTVANVRLFLEQTFEQVDSWFDRPVELLSFCTSEITWSIDLILEHISLTNQFLLKTVNKQARIARRRATRGDAVTRSESDLQRIQVIGQRGSFQWNCPDHMKPTGQREPHEIRKLLQQQLKECTANLAELVGGAGALVSIAMSVNQLGKIDLYQWLYFLGQHAKRHLQQMESIEKEFSVRTRD